MRIKISHTDEKINSNGGLVLVGQQLKKIKFNSYIDATLKNNTKRSDAIADRDILVSYIGLLCMGYTSFDDIEKFYGNIAFKHMLGIKDIPSSETLRQRLDKLATNPLISDIMLEVNLRLIQETKLKNTTSGGMEFIVIDIDTSPMDNSGSLKEGVSNTYKNFMGYCPVFAYLSEHGYMLNCNLKPGKEHSMSGAVEFIEKCIEIADKLGITEKLLFRFDSGFDALDVIKVISKKSYFIVKHNLRKESKEWWLSHAKSHCECTAVRKGKNRYTGFVTDKHPIKNVYAVIEAFETTVTRDNQALLIPEIEINSFWTNLPLGNEEIIELYHQHGTSEQYHSELKTDMDVEKLPSGKFATNSLILNLAQTAYNLMRRISVDIIEFENVKVSRRRIRTVILNVIYTAFKFVKSKNRIWVKLYKHDKCIKPIMELYERYS